MNYKKLVIILLIVFALNSCSLFHSEPHADVTLHSARYLNPDINGRPSPVVVMLYQLKNDYAFKQADSTALMANSARVLGADLIDKDTIEIRPNSTQDVTEKLDMAAKFLGIVVAYRNVTTESWHKVIALDTSSNKRAALTINLQSQGFTAVKK